MTRRLFFILKIWITLIILLKIFYDDRILNACTLNMLTLTLPLL